MFRILLACVLATLVSLAQAEDLPLPGDVAPAASQAPTQKSSKPHASVSSPRPRQPGRQAGKQVRGKGKQTQSRRHASKSLSVKAATGKRQARASRGARKSIAPHASKRVRAQSVTAKSGKQVHKRGARTSKPATRTPRLRAKAAQAGKR